MFFFRGLSSKQYVLTLLRQRISKMRVFVMVVAVAVKTANFTQLPSRDLNSLRFLYHLRNGDFFDVEYPLKRKTSESDSIYDVHKS